MEPQFKFTEIGMDELRAVEGGFFLCTWAKAIGSAIGDAASWAWNNLSIGFSSVFGDRGLFVNYGGRF